jgi:hypothetical protein
MKILCFKEIKLYTKLTLPGFKELCPRVAQDLFRDAKCIGGFTSHKCKGWMKIQANILAFPRQLKTTIGAGQLNYQLAGLGEGEKDV